MNHFSGYRYLVEAYVGAMISDDLQKILIMSSDEGAFVTSHYGRKWMHLLADSSDTFEANEE